MEFGLDSTRPRIYKSMHGVHVCMLACLHVCQGSAIIRFYFGSRFFSGLDWIGLDTLFVLPSIQYSTLQTSPEPHATALSPP